MATNTFTEFYVQTTGSNLNAGSTTADAASLTYASGTWVAATGIFTVASGNPLTDGVLVGDFVSIYPDAATVAVFIARVTARDAATITVSLTAKSGTAPVDGAVNTTLKVGGAWAGPNGTVGFPFTLIQATMVNSAGNTLRVNVKGGTTYNITASVTLANVGRMIIQGYTTTPGDKGRFVIDGGTTGASYAMFTVSNGSVYLFDGTFQNNGATGTSSGLVTSGGGCFFVRITVQNVRGHGFNGNAGLQVFRECYATGCNQSNTANLAGFFCNTAGDYMFIRCVSRLNTGSNANGWNTATGNGRNYHVYNCIAADNGGVGFKIDSGQNDWCILKNCDSYSNGSDGFLQDSATGPNRILIENSNFVLNGGYGISKTDAASTVLIVSNCGFYSNTSGNIDADYDICALEEDSILYASDPFTDGANGDFSISLSTGKNAGRGSFGGFTASLGYPDIGAVETRLIAASTAILVHPGMAGGMRG